MITKSPNWLMQRARLTPDKIAIETNNRNITFKQLFEKSLILSNYFSNHNIKKHTHVAVFMKNSIEIIEVIFALHNLGAVIVFLNNRLTNDELTWQIKNSDCEFLISDVNISFDDINILLSSDFPITINNSTEIQNEFIYEDTATIMFTSGTTGKPKGVMQTYGNHYHSAILSALNLGLHSNDKWLLNLPIFHISGYSTLIKSVIYGMTIVLPENNDSKTIVEAIQKHKVTLVSFVAKVLSDILHVDGDLTSVRAVLLGGGPASSSLLKSAADRGLHVYLSYGMTETASQVVTLTPDSISQKQGSGGRPLFLNSLKIIEDGSIENGYKTGEILVKGPTVMKGYYKNPVATEAAFEGEWLKTGDIGYIDNEGFLYVLDRRKDLIISGGENIYPAEIEAVIGSHPEVIEVGVTGIRDDKWGQVPVAFYVSNSGDDVDLEIFCKERLAKYKVPKRYIKVNKLPRNATGKLKRHELINYLIKDNLC
ncbi:MAG: menE [Bacillales bacterium]|jgi:O-succinylbenzoic acid--CoA ligase|nr:menE [Bacillales bacterium]